MSNLAERFFLKLCRDSITATIFFAMSINEMRAGNSTLKYAFER
jgi:hypothetical protein